MINRDFKYCGCTIRCNEKGEIELDQNDYIENIKYLNKKEGENDRELEEDEKKELKSKVGELLWVALMTRPDISFDVNSISSKVKTATVKTGKEMNKIIEKCKSRKDVLRFVPLGRFSDLKVNVYTDASFSNQDKQTRSTGGKVLVLEDSVSGKMNILSWKTKKIARVC